MTKRILKWVLPFWLLGLIIAGVLIPVPEIPILEQSSRNLFFHVPMWFTMFSCFLAGVWYSVKYLNNPLEDYDVKAVSATKVGVVFGIAGLVTGSLWARFTWGTWWTFAEPKINLSAMCMMIYAAYFVLRSSFDDTEKRAKLSAVYNVFAACTVPFLLYIIPRQLPSLHPGADGNPAFSEITAPELRLIFYPIIFGYIGLAIWMVTLTGRYERLRRHYQIEEL